jgi:hypothetical protein
MLATERQYLRSFRKVSAVRLNIQAPVLVADLMGLLRRATDHFSLLSRAGTDFVSAETWLQTRGSLRVKWNRQRTHYSTLECP